MRRPPPPTKVTPREKQIQHERRKTRTRRHDDDWAEIRAAPFKSLETTQMLRPKRLPAGTERPVHLKKRKEIERKTGSAKVWTSIRCKRANGSRKKPHNNALWTRSTSGSLSINGLKSDGCSAICATLNGFTRSPGRCSLEFFSPTKFLSRLLVFPGKLSATKSACRT